MKRLVQLVGVGACVVALGACGSSDDGGGGGGDSGGGDSGALSAKIAVIGDVSGPLAFVGSEQRQAAEVAAKDVNASILGVKLTLDTKDSQSKPAGAVTQAQAALKDSDVAGIVGYDETESGNAVLPLLERDGRPGIMLQVTRLDDRPANVFSMGPPTKRVAQLTVDEVVAKRNVKKLGVIWVQQSTTQEAAETFKQAAEDAGIDVVAYEGASLEATNFDSQITKVLAAKPDAVGVSGLTTQDGTIIAGLRARGFKGLIFAQQAADSPTTRKSAGDAFTGLVVGTYWDIAAANADAKRFVKAYESAYPDQQPPDVYALQAWDAVHIFARAVKAAGGTDKEKLVKALSEETFPAGLQDEVRFGEDGFADLKGYVVEMTPDASKVLVNPSDG